MKTKLLNIISLVCHGLSLAFGAILAISCYIGVNDLKNVEPAEGTEGLGTALGAALGAVLLMIIMIVAIAYSVIALIPFVLKLVRILTKKRGFDIACVVLGSILLVINLILLLSSGNSGFFFIAIALTLVTAATVVLNILTFKWSKKAPALAPAEEVAAE